MTPNHLTVKEMRTYDRTLGKIRNLIGSYHSIALRIFSNCEQEVTGETVRTWFAERRIPTDMCFVLYEITEGGIDPLTLCPWLAEHVELKAAAQREA